MKDYFKEKSFKKAEKQFQLSIDDQQEEEEITTSKKKKRDINDTG